MSQLDQSALEARNKLLAMFLAHILLDTLLVVIAKDMWAFIRIAIAIIVMYFVLQGRKWAKWLLVGILSLLVVALLALLVTLSAKLSTLLILGSLVLIILSIIIAFYLSSSQDLKRYFAYKRSAIS